MLREQRKIRRRLMTILGAPVGFFSSANYVSGIAVKPSELILGVDPMLALSAGVISATVLASLTLPSIAEFAWKQVNKDNATFLTTMDKDYFDSIKKYRSNPSPDNSISLSTKQSPLTTDFYGEKISNFDQYEQWKAIHSKLKSLETEEDNEEKK